MQQEELYKSLYAKYAPDLSQEELDKKLEYASTLDTNDFVNSFYQKYTGQGPNQEQVDYMNSILEQVEPEKEKEEKTLKQIARSASMEAFYESELPSSVKKV